MWYDGTRHVWPIQNFRIGMSLLNRIRIATFDSNQILKLRRSLTHCVPQNAVMVSNDRNVWIELQSTGTSYLPININTLAQHWHELPANQHQHTCTALARATCQSTSTYLVHVIQVTVKSQLQASLVYKQHPKIWG